MVVQANCRIFVSYRRDDTGLIVGRIVSWLGRDLPLAYVYRDVSYNIGGEDFITRIREEIHHAHLVLALIGPDWLGYSPS